MNLKPQFEKEDLFLITSFLAIDSLLNAFSTSTTDKLIVMNQLQESFKKGFSADKTLKKEFDVHFRTILPEITSFLNGTVSKDYQELFEIINAKIYFVKKPLALFKKILKCHQLIFYKVTFT